MTVLFIAAQDIHSLTVGLVRDGLLQEEQEISSRPEEYLATVSSVLAGWGVFAKDLDAVGVVVGPGSFTSCRVSVAIANGIAFAAGIPVIPVQNPQRLSLSRIVDQTDFTGYSDIDRFAIPVYDRPPHITLPLIHS
jgi:hypothetical protein